MTEEEDYGGYAGRLRRLCRKITEVMQEDYGGYGRRKKPGIGRYPMGPTNIDSVDIGSCLWHPTFVVDTDGGRRLRESTRMKMATQVKRCKIAYA